MIRARSAGRSFALALLAALALAPGRPAFADAITRVKGKIVDNHGKPLAKVDVNFEAIDIKKRVGPLHTSKDGEFIIATLDISVAKKWKVIPELSGYKVVKISYDLVNSSQGQEGQADYIFNAKQEFPELKFPLVGVEGHNIVNFVMAKDAEFNAAVHEEAAKKQGGTAAQAVTAPAAAGAAASGGPAAPGAPGATAPAVGAPAPAAAPGVAGGKEMLEKGKQLSDAGKHEEAIAVLREYLVKDPNYPNAYYYLGKSLFETDDLTGAGQAFQKGLALMKDMKGAHFYLGNIALKEERPTDAIVEYQKELELSPGSDTVYFKLGQAYQAAGDDDKALEALNKVMMIDPSKSEAYLQAASIYEKRKDTAKANEMYQKVIALDPKNAAVSFFNIGVHAWNENRAKDATQAFKKAVEIDPSYAVAHRELARALMGSQDFDGALKHFQEYLKLSPQASDRKEIQDTIALLKK